MRTQTIRDVPLDEGSWQLPRVDATGWLVGHPAGGAGRSSTGSAARPIAPGPAGGSADPARRRRPRRTEAARAARERDLARRRRRRHGRSLLVDHQVDVAGAARSSRPTSVRRVIDPADRAERSAVDPSQRIGRRQRLALTVLVVATLALMIGRLVAGAVSGPPTPEFVDVTVRPGDTLWSIASSAVPDTDPRAVIDGIRGVNHLPDDVVRVGEVLRVPTSSG